MGLSEITESSSLIPCVSDQYDSELENPINTSQEINNTTDSSTFRFPMWGIILSVATNAPVLLFGYAGNIMVILAVWRLSHMKTITNIYICNLAVADLLVLTFCLIPNFFSHIFIRWVLGDTLCKIVPFVQGFSICASVYSLVAISIERLLLTQWPYTSRISDKTAYLIVIAIWIWSCFLSLPLAFVFQISTSNKEYPDIEFCIEVWPEAYKKFKFPYFFFVNLLLYFFIPIVIIHICHSKIRRRLKQFPIPISRSPNPDLEKAETGSKKEREAVLRMCSVVVCIFCVTWIPLYFIVLMNEFIVPKEAGLWKEVFYILYPIVQFLCTAGSAANPFVYGYCNKKFRHAFGIVCKCSITMPQRHRRRRRRPDNCMLRWLTPCREKTPTFSGHRV